MQTIMKYELEKILKNKTILGAFVVLIMTAGAMFYIGYFQSQMANGIYGSTYKGESVLSINKKIASEHSGSFNDEAVRRILEDYITNSQVRDERAPFDVFSYYVASVFLPSDFYNDAEEAGKTGQIITLDHYKIPSIEEKGFASFDKPLKIGNYFSWKVLLQVAGWLFLPILLIVILICSRIFSGETSQNTNSLLLSTKNGRTKLTLAKFISASFVSTAVFVFVHGVSLLIFGNYYGFSGWDSSLQTNFYYKMFDFPILLNMMQVYLLALVLQLAGMYFAVGVTMFISSLTKSPFTALAIGLGTFFAPQLLTELFKEGVISKLLHLFPINNYDVTNVLRLLSSKGDFFLNGFVPNILLVASVMLFVKLIAELATYLRMQYLQVK